jgi:pimeloyl-ACP methyl ester carboxylesterase
MYRCANPGRIDMSLEKHSARFPCRKRLPMVARSRRPHNRATVRVQSFPGRPEPDSVICSALRPGVLLMTTLALLAPPPSFAMTSSLPLPAAVSGDRREFSGRLGVVSYYVAGPSETQAPPLLLIHSINAAGSAYEVRPLHEHYRTRRTVYSMELPGFGHSDRSDREYTPRLMTDAILEMVEEIRRRHGPVATDALALSLSSEFLARAASEAPDRFRSIALVSPTGFDKRAPWNGPAGSTRGKRWLYDTFTVRLWSRGFFDFLTSRRSVRFFLEKTWGATNIDDGLLEYDLLTTRDPGAHHAAYYFVSGYLFSADITRVYESLSVPVWMSHGVRGDFTDYRHKAAFAGRANWSFDTFQTGALPHFEGPEAFFQRYDAFLEAAPR